MFGEYRGKKPRLHGN